MIRNFSRDTSVKELGLEKLERKRCFEDNKNLISQEFPLNSPTKKTRNMRTRTESKKILSRKKGFNIISHTKKQRKRSSRRKSVRVSKLKDGVSILKEKKKGKSIIKTTNEVAKNDRGKRIIKLKIFDSKFYNRPSSGKKIISERNNTSSVFRPRKFLKRKIRIFERDPKVDIIAGTPPVIEKVKQGRVSSAKKFEISHSLRPLFDCSKKRISFRPLVKKKRSRAIKRRITPKVKRRTSFILPQDLEENKENIGLIVKPCTRSSVSYNILSWRN